MPGRRSEIGEPARLSALRRSPVSSHNEWDPLEEVVIGRLDDVRVPAAPSAHLPRSLAGLARFAAGRRYPRVLTGPARRELAELVARLEGEGVRVRRPAASGRDTACPRDGFLVVGDEIIEAPRSPRSRRLDGDAFRALFQEYFLQGARWTAAPRRTSPDVTQEAPDFVRCGRDVFALRDAAVDALGVEWLRRHLGEGYRVHEIASRSRQPMPTDASFVPLAPGRVMINPAAIDPSALPRVLKSWEVLVAPPPDPSRGLAGRLANPWLCLGVLSLDERRVLCEATQPSLVRALREWGFRPIPLELRHFAALAGSLHRAVLDVRRRGELRSYF